MNQVTTELERVNNYQAAISENNHYQIATQQTLTQPELEVLELNPNLNNIPDSSIRLPMSLSSYHATINRLGLLGTNQRYLGKLQQRNRSRKKLKIL